MRLLLTIIFLGLAGCVTQPTIKPAADSATHAQHLKSLDGIQAFNLKGRIAVNANGKGYSGSVSWAHQPNQDSMDVFTPLGGKAAHIVKNAHEVSLTNAKGETISAQSVEALTEKTLGWRLPLSGLSDWAVGRPTAAPITHQAWDELGRLTQIEQQGWQIEYAQYTAYLNTVLPQKITLKNQNLQLRLVIEQWTPPSN